MFLKAPFALPTTFLRHFGYPGKRRFVALYWTPSGDEACFDDGQALDTYDDRRLVLEFDMDIEDIETEVDSALGCECESEECEPEDGSELPHGTIIEGGK